MRFLPTRIHGIIDYLWGVALLAMPFLLGLPSGGAAGWIALAFGAGAILYSLLTAYELGLLPVIPMPVHLGLDAVAGLVLALQPVVFTLDRSAGATFVAFGLFAVVASFLTRTHPADMHLRA
ncbi:hypothetical protein [uncultured Enterovirga sp.]|uniref:SPW repeat domain-containing protein n=1 Tax=uncultured Enterovirga sp. TaxID=2026352 RepID=UPI0035CAD13D